MKLIEKHETMQVKILRSMYIRGEYHAAGTVVEVSKMDGREMVFRERAAPYVPEAPAPAATPQPPTTSGPADGVTANGEAPNSSAKSDENVGGAQPSAEPAPAATPEVAPARRRKPRHAPSAPAEPAPAVEQPAPPAAE